MCCEKESLSSKIQGFQKPILVSIHTRSSLQSIHKLSYTHENFYDSIAALGLGA